MYCVDGVCGECATAYKNPNPAVPKYFCSATCRDTWNNRRKLRGALMLDLMMVMRFDRSAAKTEDAWSTLCRMTADFKQEDVEANRSSVAPLRIIRERTIRFRSIKGGRVSKK